MGPGVKDGEQATDIEVLFFKGLSVWLETNKGGKDRVGDPHETEGPQGADVASCCPAPSCSLFLFGLYWGLTREGTQQ